MNNECTAGLSLAINIFVDFHELSGNKKTHHLINARLAANKADLVAYIQQRHKPVCVSAKAAQRLC